MEYLEELEKLVRDHHGTILSSELDRQKIPRTYLQMMVAAGKLVRMDRGVYVSVDSIEDEMFAIQQKYPTIIYSHETALFIHGLTDRAPFEYSATVPSGYKVVERLGERCKIYYIKKELHELGTVTTESSFGNSIKVYSAERTLCDLIRSRNRIDVQISSQAIKRFGKLSSIDYSLVMYYARKFKIGTVVAQYLEVLA